MDPRNPGRPALVENHNGFTFQLAFALFVSSGSRLRNKRFVAPSGPLLVRRRTRLRRGPRSPIGMSKYGGHGRMWLICAMLGKIGDLGV